MPQPGQHKHRPVPTSISILQICQQFPRPQIQIVCGPLLIGVQAPNNYPVNQPYAPSPYVLDPNNLTPCRWTNAFSPGAMSWSVNPVGGLPHPPPLTTTWLCKLFGFLNLPQGELEFNYTKVDATYSPYGTYTTINPGIDPATVEVVEV